MAALLALITSESSTTALILSLKTAGASTALCLLLGVPMALVLARDGRSAVLITHDLLDVLTPADRVLVLETGQIVETGTTATFMAIPRSRFGARFAGPNLVGGTAHGDGVLTTQWGPDAVAGESAVALYNPSAVAVYRDKPHGTQCSTVEVTVAELDDRGPVILG